MSTVSTLDCAVDDAGATGGSFIRAICDCCARNISTYDAAADSSQMLLPYNPNEKIVLLVHPVAEKRGHRKGK